jgi:hypothetical protein
MVRLKPGELHRGVRREELFCSPLSELSEVTAVMVQELVRVRAAELWSAAPEQVPDGALQ